MHVQSAVMRQKLCWQIEDCYVTSYKFCDFSEMVRHLKAKYLFNSEISKYLFSPAHILYKVNECGDELYCMKTTYTCH
jgi:hypothetical protein